MNEPPVIISDDLAGSTQLVIRALEERGWTRQIIETSRLSDASVSLSIGVEGGSEFVRFHDEEVQQEVRITRNTRILRRQPALPAYSVDAELAVAAFVNSQYRSAMNSLFTVEACWMNEAFADRQMDQNKLLGARIAHQVGLRTIPTLLTDSPIEWCKAVANWGRLGDLCVKPAGAWAAEIIDADTTLSLFSTRLDQQAALELASNVSHASVLLQPYVDKAYELRVTMVGAQSFACRIDSQRTERTATDWRRYDFENTPHDEYDLPGEVEDMLRAFMIKAQLVYAAIDLIVTPNGDYVFVEANPAGQFGWIEELSGLQISAAIARWLLGEWP